MEKHGSCFFASKKKVHKNRVHGGKTPASSLKIHSACQAIYHLILFSHWPFSSLFLRRAHVYLVSSFCLYYADAFLVSRVPRTSPLYPLLGRKSIPGWCAYLPKRQEPHTWSSPPRKLHPFQKGTCQQHRSLWRIAGWSPPLFPRCFSLPGAQLSAPGTLLGIILQKAQPGSITRHLPS